MSVSRRSEERKNTVHYSRVFHAHTNILVGYAVDASDSGIRLMSMDPLEPGRELELRMDLPEQINGVNAVEFTAVVQWCERDINPEYKAIGLRILSPTDELSCVLATVQSMLSFDE